MGISSDRGFQYWQVEFCEFAYFREPPPATSSFHFQVISTEYWVSNKHRNPQSAIRHVAERRARFGNPQLILLFTFLFPRSYPLWSRSRESSFTFQICLLSFCYAWFTQRPTGSCKGCASGGDVIACPHRYRDHLRSRASGQNGFRGPVRPTAGG